MGISKELGIDLGSANTLVYIKNNGIAVNEPTVVTIDKTSGEILAVGTQAKEMIGRTPDNLITVKPVRNGVVSDFDATTALLRFIIKHSLGYNAFFKPRTVVTVPSCITDVEKRAVLETLIRAGAKDAYIIESPIAAALGSDIDIDSIRGTMVVDIGAGTTEIAIISLGGIVVCKSVRIAGNKIDRAIAAYIEKEYSLICGEITAENVKLTAGTCGICDTNKTFEIGGRDKSTNMPKTIVLSQEEIKKAITSPLLEITSSIRQTLEKCPPELSGDIIENGILLCGGSALIEDIGKFISSYTDLKVTVCANPQTCIAEGLGKIVDNRKRYNYLLSPTYNGR